MQKYDPWSIRDFDSIKINEVSVSTFNSLALKAKEGGGR
jgi:hypothetical protein